MSAERAEVVALCEVLSGATLIVAHVGDKKIGVDPRMFTALADAQREVERLTKQRDGWEEDARRYALNADFWRERAAALEAAIIQHEATHAMCTGTMTGQLGLCSPNPFTRQGFQNEKSGQRRPAGPPPNIVNPAPVTRPAPRACTFSGCDGTTCEQPCPCACHDPAPRPDCTCGASPVAPSGPAHFTDCPQWQERPA